MSSVFFNSDREWLCYIMDTPHFDNYGKETFCRILRVLLGVSRHERP